MGYIEHNTYEEMLMQYGVTLPNVGVEARILADLAHDAEEAAWDGVFVWDAGYSVSWWWIIPPSLLPD